MRLGPYELVRKIGAGGMGEVWAAHRIASSGHEVIAVKCLPERLADDPALQHTLLQEARLAMLLRHPNIVHVFDAGEANGQAYIAMEFVHGLDLARLRKHMELTGERLPPTVVAHVIAQILTGLDYAHNLVHDAELISLVHRDISPHNVMLSVKGEIKLTDFGVARLSSEDTSGTHVKGKARYMPPEQLRGESRSPGVDLFAAGAVLQEMLDGSVFRGDALDDARLLGMAVDGTVPAPRHPHEIPRPLERLRRGLLAPDPRQRLPSASAALELLQDWPGYRDVSPQVAAIVMRYLERQAGFPQQVTQTGLAHQATFLHTNAISLEASDDFLAFDALLDESMLSAPLERQLEPSSAPPFEPPFEPGFSLTSRSTGSPRTLGGAELPPLDVAPSRPATGGQRSVEQLGESALELDIPANERPSFARHVATSPNPVVPKRRLRGFLAILVGLGLAGVAGVGLIHLLELIETRRASSFTSTPTSNESGLRKARVIGDQFAGYAGFGHPRMDRLAADDILYEYVSSPQHEDAGSLAALAAGEAEFALTTLDQLLRARAGAGNGAPASSGAKIVAVVAVSLGADALVLDSVEHPSLRSLEDLTKLGRKLGQTPVLAYADGTPGASLERSLDALLGSIDRPALQRDSQYADPHAVYDALVASASEDAPIVAAMLSEPWLSEARDAGMTVAASTRDLPHAVVDILVASERALADDPQLVDAVVASYYEVVLAQQTEPDEREALIQLVARDLGLTPAEAAQTLSGMCRFDAAGAEPWLRASGDHPAMLGVAIDATWSALDHSLERPGPAPTLESLVAAGPLVAAAASEREDPGFERPNTCVITSPGAAKTRPAQPLGALELGADAPWFVANDAALSGDQAERVGELVARLRRFNPTTVTAVITGFGDDRGNKGRALGQARARTLVDALRSAGVEMPLDPRGAPNGAAAPSSQLRINLSRLNDN